MVILVTILVSLLVESFADYIPFEFEVSVSRQIEDKIKLQNNQVDDYLQQLANQIVPYMKLPEGIQVKLHYVNDDQVNAMATLGGHVLVYRGLLEKMPNENTLMMLLGHEIAHLKMRHPVKALSKGMIMSLLWSTILGHSSDSVANVMSESSLLTLLSFSRDQEQLSDEQAIQALNSFYDHVQGATQLFEVLQQDKQQYLTVPQFLNSHPDTSYRIKRLNELAEKQHWTQQGKINLIPDSILQILANDKNSGTEL